jgi:hypothetical protein
MQADNSITYRGWADRRKEKGEERREKGEGRREKREGIGFRAIPSDLFGLQGEQNRMRRGN